uniref:type II toxin-antitoxin system tRNA(fMet)-specific endonuclease VapC n=1 Tax=Pseudothauera rhizosphaerae TaxID=2565932 RepID=UPI0038B53D88
MKYLLDTNIVIYTMRNRPQQVRECFGQHEGQFAISTVTLAELAFGAERSSRPRENMEVLESFIARLDVLDFDAAAAFHFGQIRAELLARGQPIGPYDMMIAAHARSHGLILVTNNLAEFERVAGLRLENWA